MTSLLIRGNALALQGSILYMETFLRVTNLLPRIRALGELDEIGLPRTEYIFGAFADSALCVSIESVHESDSLVCKVSRSQGGPYCQIGDQLRDLV